MDTARVALTATAARWKATYEVRREAGRSASPSVVIVDGQSVKTTERGGVRGFDAHKCVKGRKRQILVGTLILPIACRVEPANMSDRRAASLILGGLNPLFPDSRTVIADAGYESQRLARELWRDAGWRLQIVKRVSVRSRLPGSLGLWSVPSHGLAANRRISKDYEYNVQTSQTLIDIAAIRLMLNRLESE